MKHLYALLAAGAIFATSANAAVPPRFAHRAPDLETRRAAALRATPFERLHRAAVNAGTKTYKPQLESYYFYENGRWIIDSTTSYEYDSDGRICLAESEDGNSIFRITYTYDDFGQQICSVMDVSTDGGKTWAPEEKKEANYDLIVHDFQLDNLRYAFDIDNDNWALNYGHRRVVARNEAGAVTRVDLMLYNYGMTNPDGNPMFDMTKYSTCKYDDATPTIPAEWSFFELTLGDNYNDLYWLENTRFSNIVWDRTDGQMLSFDEIDYKTGANRIASCDILDEGLYPSTMTVEYPGGIDYHSLIVSHAADFEGTVDETLTALDDNGSVRQLRIVKGTEAGQEYTMEMQTEYIYDSYGNITKEEGSFTTDGVVEDYSCAEYENIYDDRGALLSYICSEYDVDADTMLPVQKAEYSDFLEFDSAGIIGSDMSADAFSLRDRTLAIAADGTWQLEVLDLGGATVARSQGHDAGTADLSAISAGIYIATLRGDTGTVTAKIALR